MRQPQVKIKAYKRSYRLSEGINPRPLDPTAGAKRIINMYVDKEGGDGSLESIPGFRRLYSFGERIHNILSLSHTGKDYIYVHAGTGLYRFKKEERDSLSGLCPIAYLKDTKSVMKGFGDCLFINDTERLIAVDGEGEIRILSENPDIVSCSVMTVYDGRLIFAGGDTGELIYSSKMRGEMPEEISEGRIATEKIGAMKGCAGGLYIITEGGIERWESNPEDGLKMADALPGIRAREIYPLDGRLLLLGEGLYSLTLPLSGGGKIKHLSEAVRSEISLGEWQICGLWRGYLTLFLGTKILLCDAESITSDKASWFSLSGIGCYQDDKRVYRYSPVAEAGYEIHKTPDSVCRGEAVSLIDECGNLIFYEENDGKKYRIYPTEEFRGGEISAIGSSFAEGNFLWFGTERGEICIFNNDRERCENYYSFAGHAAEYFAELHPDDCALADLRKSTLPASFILKLKTFGKGSVKVTVLTDGRTAFLGKIAPAKTDAEKTADAESHMIPERAKGWREKQIIISGNEFCSPFGIISLSYRFETK